MTGPHAWRSSPPRFDIVALAASAGGLAAFRSVLARLPFDFAAPILILQHRMYRGSGEDALLGLLQEYSAVEVRLAQQGMQLKPSVAYVGPPGQHLLLSQDRRLVVSDSPPLNHYRPSADLLFASLAAQFGPRLMVGVLSGSRSDGAIGVMNVKACGGAVLVQDPATAICAGMPRAAISTGCADLVLPIDALADALTVLSMVPGATELFLRRTRLKNDATWDSAL